MVATQPGSAILAGRSGLAGPSDLVRLDQLTISRFVAAIVVVQMHFGPAFAEWGSPSASVFTMAGQTAVTWFYTLSGFILATVHRDLRGRGASGFWWARFSRISPLFVCGLIADAAITGATPLTHPIDWALNLLLVQAWVPPHALALNGPGWSISVEAAFYALFPWLIAAARAGSTARLWAATALLWAVTQVSHTALVAHLHPSITEISFQLLYYWPPSHLNEFVIGIAAAVTVSRHRPSVPLAILMVCAGLASVFVLRWWIEPALPAPAGYDRDDWVGLLAPAFAAIMVGLSTLDLPCLRGRALRLLGEASFAIYLLQLPLAGFCIRHGIGVGTLRFYGALIGVGIAVHLGIEQPVRRRMRAWGARRHGCATGKPPGVHEITLDAPRAVLGNGSSTAT